MTGMRAEVVFVFSLFSLRFRIWSSILPVYLSVCHYSKSEELFGFIPSVLLAGTAAADVGAWDKMDFPLPRAAFLALLNGGSLKC